MNQTRFKICPVCGDEHSCIGQARGSLRCCTCGQVWHPDYYVLVEFPDNSSYFEGNGIGYPSFESRDNGARYVNEYDYIRHFKKNPPANAYFMQVQWPESQLYLYPDKPEDSVNALDECINDEKGIEDFGEQAVWVPLCNIYTDAREKT